MPGEVAKNSWVLSFTFSMLLMSQMVLHTRASGTDFTPVQPQGPETNTHTPTPAAMSTVPVCRQGHVWMPGQRVQYGLTWAE